MKARQRVDKIRDLLRQIGLEAERVRMYNISSAMASQFAEATIDMTEEITKLGPNPLKAL